MAKTVRSIPLSQRKVTFPNGTVVEAPGLAAEVTQWSGAELGFRSGMYPGAQDLDPRFEAALAEVGIDVQETIHLDVKAVAPGLRGTVRGEPKADAVTLAPTKPPRDGVQVVLFQDESGGVSWHFPDGHFARAKGKAPGLRSAKAARFTIPSRTVPARAASAAAPRGLRGPIAKLGRKVFKVLLVPLSKIIAKPVQAIVGKVEQKYRQELVRGVTADNYRQHVGTPFDAWDTLEGKRSLLIVHGILSTTEGMLSGLARPAMEELVRAYEGRVIALDQLTVTRDPQENASRFLQTIAQHGGNFQFDILCHSRGGIVARTLAERGRILVPEANCDFSKVFFVATPNHGSRLADPEHMVAMLDVFTNWSTNFPDGAAAYSIEVILSIVKLLAYTVADRLPGVAAMSTKGYIADVLNRSTEPSPAQYAAAASDYEPDPSRDNAFYTGRFANWIVDRVFQKASNDLVVPCDGVFAANGHPSFPIENPLVYAPSDAVWHTDFFSRPQTVRRMLSFLGGLRMAAAAAPAMRSVRPRTIDTRGALPAAGAPDPAAGVRIPLSTKRRKNGGGAKSPALRSARTAGAGMGRGAPVATAAATVALPAQKVLERKPEIDFHEQVTAGETNELVVRLSDLLVAGAADNIRVELVQNEDQAEITVSVHAPGFVVEPESAKLLVRPERDPDLEQAKFNLTARNLGPAPVRREISADFWHRNALVGAVTHITYVVPPGLAWSRPGDAGTSRPDAFVLRDGRRDDCDLIIKVEGENEPGVAPFRMKARSTVPGNEYESKDFGRLNLPPEGLSSYVNTAVQGLIDAYPDLSGLSEKKALDKLVKWNADFMLRLRDLGKQLWTFLPQAFRDEYFALYTGGKPPRSILVHSDEMLFPWELAIPNRAAGGKFKELDPLGVLHVLGRWRPGMTMRPPMQRMTGHKFVIMRPQYTGDDDLPWAKDEEDAIRKLLPGAEVLRPIDADAVRRLLDRNDVRILHFSGHGEFDQTNADLSRLVLEGNSTIDPLALGNTKLGAEGAPILYLNACAVGSLGITVGRAGGFAATCLQGGYSGIIAPYFPVNDASAAAFSEELYARLAQGRTIGEALRELRDANRDDPAFHAFAYFGDPWTRVDLSRLMVKPGKPKRPAAGGGARKPSRRGREASRPGAG
jgi:hypothetical protein